MPGFTTLRVLFCHLLAKKGKKSELYKSNYRTFMLEFKHENSNLPTSVMQFKKPLSKDRVFVSQEFAMKRSESGREVEKQSASERDSSKDTQGITVIVDNYSDAEVLQEPRIPQFEAAA